ncbi:hypothetical protein ACFOZY_04285 [Chungangia koreensis]|uniref:Uncharacterized protein n=1 Tax=Chungangia koreensis TaxID=752657 RepID=A0ABV8X2X7_9LACT
MNEYFNNLKDYKNKYTNLHSDPRHYLRDHIENEFYPKESVTKNFNLESIIIEIWGSIEVHEAHCFKVESYSLVNSVFKSVVEAAISGNKLYDTVFAKKKIVTNIFYNSRRR